MDQDRRAASDIDLPLDREEDSERQVDTATLVAAKTFGSIALPKNISAAKAAFIEAAADTAQNAVGAENFVIGVNGPINEPTRAERQRHADEDNLDYLISIGEEAQEQRRLEREREEWSHTRSTVGGVTMTGAEWRKLAERLRTDDDLHRRLIDAFEKRGMTAAEAETRYVRVADVAGIAAIPEGQRTEDQVAAFERAKADPAFSQDMRDVERAAQSYSKPNVAPVNVDIAITPRNGGTPEAASKPAPAAERSIVAITGPGF